jgi:hypothetical protein
MNFSYELAKITQQDRQRETEHARLVSSVLKKTSRHGKWSHRLGLMLITFTKSITKMKKL